MLNEIQGDLLEYEVDVIAHQCNCVTRGCSGIAYPIFRDNPQANTYTTNPNPTNYGSAQIFKANGKPYKYIANIYGQYDVGHPRPLTIDSAEMRRMAFSQGLDIVYDWMMENGCTSIAFPKGIGCGLAGGDWEDYHQMILNMSTFFPEFTTTIVELV